MRMFDTGEMIVDDGSVEFGRRWLALAPKSFVGDVMIELIV